MSYRALGGIAAETLAGIMGEIELLRNLHHPNIVDYIGSFKTRRYVISLPCNCKVKKRRGPPCLPSQVRLE